MTVVNLTYIRIHNSAESPWLTTVSSRFEHMVSLRVFAGFHEYRSLR
jgi:hypothetical protein